MRQLLGLFPINVFQTTEANRLELSIGTLQISWTREYLTAAYALGKDQAFSSGRPIGNGLSSLWTGRGRGGSCSEVIMRNLCLLSKFSYSWKIWIPVSELGLLIAYCQRRHVVAVSTSVTMTTYAIILGYRKYYVRGVYEYGGISKWKWWNKTYSTSQGVWMHSNTFQKIKWTADCMENACSLRQISEGRGM